MMAELISTAEFNKLVHQWCNQVRLMSQATLARGTHSTGALGTYLTAFIDKNKADDAAYKVKFHFDRYGVFRAYGAGRGYVVINGQLVRGQKIRSYREIREKKWTDVTLRYLKLGYTTSEVNRLKSYKVDSENTVARTPLDWIDQHVDANIMRLADYVQEYYGDKSLRDLLLDFNKIKIVKANGRQ